MDSFAFNNDFNYQRSSPEKTKEIFTPKLSKGKDSFREYIQYVKASCQKNEEDEEQFEFGEAMTKKRKV